MSKPGHLAQHLVVYDTTKCVVFCFVYHFISWTGIVDAAELTIIKSTISADVGVDDERFDVVQLFVFMYLLRIVVLGVCLVCFVLLSAVFEQNKGHIIELDDVRVNVC